MIQNMLKKSKHLIFINLFGIMICTQLEAGTISGAGGHLSRYSENPWFFSNTSEVNYCVVHNSTTFHIPTAAIVPNIEWALDYYRRFFQDWRKRIGEDKYRFRLGTQIFKYQAQCDESTDLRFQLGTLTPNQRELVVDPSAYAGVATMTSYDTVNMKAKGFIYLGANAGVDKMQGSVPVDPDPWRVCEQLPFRIVLLHELAHIFGLDHESGSQIFAGEVPEEVVSQAYVSGLRASRDRKICREEEAFRFEGNNFFDAYLRDSSGLTAEFRDHPEVAGEQIQATLDVGNLPEEYLFVKLEDGRRVIFAQSFGQMVNKVKVILPPDQVYFPDLHSQVFLYQSIQKRSWLGKMVGGESPRDVVAELTSNRSLRITYPEGDSLKFIIIHL